MNASYTKTEKIAALRTALDNRTIADIRTILASDHGWSKHGTVGTIIDACIEQSPNIAGLPLSGFLHWLATIHLSDEQAQDPAASERRLNYTGYMTSFGSAITQMAEEKAHLPMQPMLSDWREVCFRPELSEIAQDISTLILEFTQEQMTGFEEIQSEIEADTLFLKSHPTILPPIVPKIENATRPTEIQRRPLR